MKVNIIIARYGEGIPGGAERHCRDILSILPEDWDIHVYTSAARDYITWKNEFPVGTEKNGNLTVHRYKTYKSRNIRKFNILTERLRKKFPKQTEGEEWNWLLDQGPYCRQFVHDLDSGKIDGDLDIYFSYLYFPTVYGLLNSPRPKAIIPMLHDEFPAYLNLYKKALTDKILYAFNAPEEVDLFRRIYGFLPSRYALIGTYVDLPRTSGKATERNPPYLLTIGRLDPGKGFHELFSYFTEWKKNTSHSLELWIAGAGPKTFRKLFSHPSIRFLGQVTEEEKKKLLSDSWAVVNPSPLESFSILLMEAWSYGKPVIANANSEVLKGHCERSNGGLYYRDFDSFQAVLDHLLEEQSLRIRLGWNGREYVKKNFTKDRIRAKWMGFLGNV